MYAAEVKLRANTIFIEEGAAFLFGTVFFSFVILVTQYQYGSSHLHYTRQLITGDWFVVNFRAKMDAGEWNIEVTSYIWSDFNVLLPLIALEIVHKSVTCELAQSLSKLLKASYLRYLVHQDQALCSHSDLLATKMIDCYFFHPLASLAQSVEHFLLNWEVLGSNSGQVKWLAKWFRVNS